MKKASFICFVSFSLACPFKTTAGNTYTPKSGIQSNQPVGINFINPQQAPATSIFKLLRLKLIIDEYDNDDIAIAFDSAATTKYNDQLDARYLPGINAAEALYSLSSDSVPLSIDILPLPKLSALNIRLHVGSQKSGQLTLERTELDSIPAIYEVWLIDKYKKDSLDLRTNTSYIFNIISVRTILILVD